MKPRTARMKTGTRIKVQTILSNGGNNPDSIVMGKTPFLSLPSCRKYTKL
jgi:hypothetical protein